IFGERNKVHVIDLSQTVPYMQRALAFIQEVAASGGRILFVGTKRQAQDPIAEAAKRCGHYYVNSRWLGGMLTNWTTISKSIKKLKDLDEVLDSGAQGLTKKEALQLQRQRDKLEASLGGIRDMGGVPDVIFLIDTNKEEIAIQEANNLKIPVVAILDTNCNPDGIAFPVPGNDDASRAIKLYCDLIADAILDGGQSGASKAGVDIGASEEPLAEPAVVEAEAEAEAAPEAVEEVAVPAEEAAAETDESEASA
ncbi:MAG: 30S ribosomal protein S2, partial [Pseudomonadota bacterium]